MTNSAPVTRRDFLKVGSAAAGGLILGWYLPFGPRAAAARADTVFAPNAFIRIATDDTITLVLHKVEMGQGVYTSLPMFIAEELEIDLERIKIEFAPVHKDYGDLEDGWQGTGGSASIRSSADRLRTLGATAREMLIAAAADRWGVAASSCHARNGRVVHDPSGRQASYGELADAAAKVVPPTSVKLKQPDEYRILGTSPKRLDAPLKVTGKAEFGLDVRVPGMLTAVVARPPVLGGAPRTVDARAAKQVRGVVDVVRIGAGVAVVAESTWAALRGREALAIEWDHGANAGISTVALRRKYADLAQTPGRIAHEQGDVQKARSAAVKAVEAVYELPFLAHAPMEPLNCVADVRADRCEIWTGTQAPDSEQAAAAEITGLAASAIQVHTTFLGGGFGRRGNPRCDFVRPAVELSKAIGKPVKVVWTREDDTRGGFYRPMHYARFSGGLDSDGMPIVWTHRLVGGSIFDSVGFGVSASDGIDPTSVEGAREIPYAIPNQFVDYHPVDDGLPLLWWRSVGSSINAFTVECFIDELAAAAGRDPLEFRRRLMGGHPRELAVLELAAKQAGWGGPLPEGRARGIAVHKSFGSYCAQVAEVSVGADGKPRVHRVVCAIDCGTAFNPDNVRAQMESGIAYGLSAALYGMITFNDGRVEQGNFDAYPVLRIDEMPEVDVHILNGGGPLGGIGEPGTPPAAPAVCNAIHALTGNRIRTLPIAPQTPRPA